jgi:hypothetical protein
VPPPAMAMDVSPRAMAMERVHVSTPSAHVQGAVDADVERLVNQVHSAIKEPSPRTSMVKSTIGEPSPRTSMHVALQLIKEAHQNRGETSTRATSAASQGMPTPSYVPPVIYEDTDSTRATSAASAWTSAASQGMPIPSYVPQVMSTEEIRLQTHRSDVPQQRSYVPPVMPTAMPTDHRTPSFSPAMPPGYRASYVPEPTVPPVTDTRTPSFSEPAMPPGFRASYVPEPTTSAKEEDARRAEQPTSFVIR